MYNRIGLQGRLTEVPEIKHTPNGTAVTEFSVAVEDSRTTNGERKTNFFKIKAWNGTAELICKYFVKGQQIIIDGRLDSKTYTDKNDVKRKDVYVVAESVSFCGAKSSEAQEKDIDEFFDDVEPVPETVE